MPGSDRFRVIPLPFVQVTYRDRLFIGRSRSGVGGAVGGYVVRSSRATVAFEAGMEQGRPASRADALAGMEDRDAVANLGMSATYRIGPAEAGVSVSRGLNDGAGLLGNGRVSVSRVVGRAVVRVGAGVSFADARQMRREFGVTPAEAQRRRALIAAGDQRLEPEDGESYVPGSGLRHVAGSLMIGYRVSERWSLLGSGGLQYLGSEPATSPLVRRRKQWSVGMGLGRRL